VAIVSVALTAALLGCDKSMRAPVRAVDNRVVVSVDGVALTRGQVDARVGLMLKVARKANPRMEMSAYVSTSNKLATTYPQVFVQRQLVRNYAKLKGIAVSEELLAQYRKLALKQLRAYKAKSYDALLDALGGDAELLDEQVRDEALVEAVRKQVVAANPTNLPPDYVARRLAEIKDYNTRMDATNALIHARANNVWLKLKAGASFERMVDLYTEIPEERMDKGEWGTLDKRLLADYPALLKAVLKLKPGEFSAPVEGDNGLMIVRLDGKNESEGEDEYALSRIFFQLPMFALEDPPEKLIARAQEEHATRVWAETLMKLEKDAKIEYKEEKK